MLRFTSSILRFIKAYSFRIEYYCYDFFGNFVGWKMMSWRKINERPISNDKTTTSPTPPPWHLLPDDILRSIFKNLWVGDRVRSRLVCKSWKRILTGQDCNNIPKMPEAPWEILSDDSYKKLESCGLKEIRFKSLSEQQVYRFRLPPLIIGGWLCGSSRGWLLIAVGSNLIKVNMFLWQPLSGATWKLPPLSTLPFFDEYIQLAIKGKIENLSSVVHRVQVFSMGSIKCIVAVIFRRNTCDEIALCTPQEETWIVFGGGNNNIKLRYSDMLFHSTRKQLCALAIRISPEGELENFMLNYNRAILLKDCQVRMGIFFVPVDDQNIIEAQFHQGLQFAHAQKEILHFVESPLTHKFLLVYGLLDCVVSEHAVEPIARFRCQQTTKFRIFAQALKLQRDFVTMSSIGKETIFLGAAGSFSTPSVEGVEADCVYFTTDDAEGLALHNGENKHYVVREHGVFSLQHKKMRRISFTTVRYRSGSKVGWFMPQSE